MKSKSKDFQQSRRDFLWTSLLAGTYLYTGCSSFSPFYSANTLNGEMILLPVDPVFSKNGITDFLIIDIAKGSSKKIALPMELAHACFVNPQRPEQVYILEQDGPRACEVNLAKNTLTNSFVLTEDYNYFYGHGVFTNDGEYFITTEVIGKNAEGQIVVRKTSDFSPIGTIPSYGHKPHDLKLIGDSLLVVANHGSKNSPSCVSFVDLKNKKLVNKITVSEPETSASHLAIVGNQEIVAVCRKQRSTQQPNPKNAAERVASVRDRWKYIEHHPAPLYWISEGKLVAKSLPENIYSDMRNSLSVIAVNKLNTLAITHERGDIVSFWDISQRKLKTATKMPGLAPHGIVYLEANNTFAVTTIDGFRFVDAQSLSLKEKKMPAPFGIHISKTNA